MAQIAEDSWLLLLDNAAAQPALDRDRTDRVLAGAMLLDLAYACRIRPAVPGEAVDAGLLVALSTEVAPDPAVEPAFALLRQRPLTPAQAVARLRKESRETIALHAERIGLTTRIPLTAKRFSSVGGWSLTSRERVGEARAALLATLFDRTPPTPATAAIVTLLHAVDGLGALLSLNDRGWRWVHARSTEISTGSWVDESPTALPEVNLAVTASALRPSLG